MDQQPELCLQSTKLCVFEERVLEIVAATRDLPGNLATTGVSPFSNLNLVVFVLQLSSCRSDAGIGPDLGNASAQESLVKCNLRLLPDGTLLREQAGGP